MDTMTSTTFSRRLQQLIQQLDNHPHREEILRMAMEQLIDDQSVSVLPQ